MLLSTSTCRD